MSDANTETHGPVHGQLSLWDTVSIIVGIVIGSSIFTIPTIIFIRVAGPWEVLGVGAFGGFLSLIGAPLLCELATTYPRYGGDYVVPDARARWADRLSVWLGPARGHPNRQHRRHGVHFGNMAPGCFGVNADQQRGALVAAEKDLKDKKAEVEALPKEKQAEHPAAVFRQERPRRCASSAK